VPTRLLPDRPVITAEPDLARMRRERHARLVEQMRAQGVEACVLLGQTAVGYATGAVVAASEQARAQLQRAVAVVPADGSPPHVWTPFPDGIPPELPADHAHEALPVELGGPLAAPLFDALGGQPDGSIAIDEYTWPLLEQLRASGATLVDAGPLLGAAKVAKTADELACLAQAQRINDAAMADVRPLARPGVRQTDLSAAFLRRIRELGATANSVDPVWQAMPAAIADGPFTNTGDVIFPTPTTDRILRDGDVVWVDSGIQYQGYATDFGRTWLVGRDRRPDAFQRDCYERWVACVERVLAVVKPGATGGDITRAAARHEPRRPWLAHFYVIHGCGVDNAEPPLIGTDLGPEFDESIVLAPGMVLVLEPVIWHDGHAGYRAEETVAVTDDGWVAMTNAPHPPFDGSDGAVG
jgi:Xaa-Pro aminopeptidase